MNDVLSRHCNRKDGKPKTAYATREGADAAARMASANLRGEKIEPYACEDHGWHIGHPRVQVVTQEQLQRATQAIHVMNLAASSASIARNIFRAAGFVIEGEPC